jgi:hypothetical protein
MYQVKKEEGYALVTVLLITTVFMILFLSFMGQASSSVKQNRVVEKSSQSTAISEMGISYYQVAVQNIFELNQQKVTDQVNVKVNGGSTQDLKSLAADSFKDIIKLELQKENEKVQIDGYPKAFFSIKNIDTIIITGTNKIKVSFLVDGTEEDRTSTLEAEMTIDLDSIIKGDDSTINYVLPAFNEIKIPNSSCTSFEAGCNEILLNGTQAFPGKNDNNGNNNNLSDKTVYSTGGLNVDGNANKSYKLKIHANDSITLDGNMNSASNLTIETPKSITFYGNLKVESSRILIGENLTTTKQFNLDLGTFTFVGINANINTLTLSSNSTMCVQGNLTVSSKSVDSTSKLIVLGTINGTPTSLSQEDFETQCGTFLSQNLTINWGQGIQTNVENVNYQ